MRLQDHENGPDGRDESTGSARSSATTAVHRHLDAHPSSVSFARHLVRDTLDGAGRGDLADDAELAVSELVTNALVHAGTAIELSLSVTGSGLVVEVGDQSVHPPQQRQHSELVGTGRGLQLVDRLTDQWGVRPNPPGKTVWFALSGARVDEPDVEVDLDALLAAFPDLDATETEAEADVEVLLLNAPLLLHAAWQLQVGSILREYLLTRFDEDGPEGPAGGSAVTGELERNAAAQDAVALLARQVPAPDLGTGPDELMAGAVEPLVTADRLVLSVPRTSVPHFAELDRTLDAAAVLADAGALLTPPVQPEMRALRRWLCREVAHQGDGGHAAAWDPSGDPVSASSDLLVQWDARTVATSERALIAAEDTNRIAAVSRAALEVLGWGTAEDLVGGRLVNIIPERYRQAHLAGFTLHLFAGRSGLLGQPVTVPALRRDGSEVLVSLLVDAVPLPGGRRVFVAELTRTD